MAIQEIVKRDEDGRWNQQDHRNGQVLVKWLREDVPPATDEHLAVFMLTLLEFLHDLDNPPGEFDPVVLFRALTDACQCAVLDLTAAARSSPGEA